MRILYACFFHTLTDSTFFITFCNDTNNDIHCQFQDYSAITDRIVYGINVKKGIDLIQWSVLLVLNLSQYFVCHSGNTPFRGLNP